MKRLFFVLGLLFSLLGILGAGYVFYTGGQASPGGPLIAMIFSLVFFQLYRTHTKQP